MFTLVNYLPVSASGFLPSLSLSYSQTHMTACVYIRIKSELQENKSFFDPWHSFRLCFPSPFIASSYLYFLVTFFFSLMPKDPTYTLTIPIFLMLCKGREIKTDHLSFASLLTQSALRKLGISPSGQKAGSRRPHAKKDFLTHTKGKKKVIFFVSPRLWRVRQSVDLTVLHSFTFIT